MDSGTAALIGTVVGSATSIATTWLSEYLRTRRANRLDKIRKERLVQLLSSDKYTWRSLKTLCDAIGSDEETAVGLLLEIGARRSITGSESWALLSRAPPPDAP